MNLPDYDHSKEKQPLIPDALMYKGIPMVTEDKYESVGVQWIDGQLWHIVKEKEVKNDH